jgi:hypothetical protein
MGFELTGDSLIRLFFGIQLAALLFALFLVAFNFGGAAGLVMVALVGLLLFVAAVALWRHHTGRTEVPVVGTPEDITDRPLVFPGQAAKERWRKAVERLPAEDDEEG